MRGSHGDGRRGRPRADTWTACSSRGNVERHGGVTATVAATCGDGWRSWLALLVSRPSAPRIVARPRPPGPTRSSSRARSSPRSASRGQRLRHRSGNPINSLTDTTGEPVHRRQRLRRQRQLLRGRRPQRATSASSRPTGHRSRPVRHRLDNPLSLVFDSKGNLYVGQQATPYIAEFSPDRAAAGRHRPGQDRALRRRLDRPFERPVHLLLHDRGHATSSPTTSAPTRKLPNFNVAPLPDVDAFEASRIPRPQNVGQRARGRLDSVILLDPERQRHPDLPVRIVAGLPGRALRHRRRPERHLVLDR